MGERVPCTSCRVTRVWVNDFPAVATAMCEKCRKRVFDDFAVASAVEAVIEAYVLDAGHGGRLVRAVRALEDAEKAREGR